MTPAGERAAPNVRALAESYIDSHGPDFRQRTITGYQQMTKRLPPSIALTKPAELRRVDLRMYLEKVARRAPTMANRFVDEVRPITGDKECVFHKVSYNPRELWFGPARLRAMLAWSTPDEGEQRSVHCSPPRPSRRTACAPCSRDTSTAVPGRTVPRPRPKKERPGTSWNNPGRRTK